LFSTINAYLNALLLISSETRTLKLDLLFLLSAIRGFEEQYINIQNGIWKHCIEDLKYKGIRKKETKKNLVRVEKILRERILSCRLEEGESIHSYLKKQSHR
jgi:hypothetical protein